MPELKALAKKSKAVRKAMHENQAEFAANCGISTETLSLIEREKSDPRLSTIQKIAAYTDCTVSELLKIE